jgi:glucosamine 6-phosphate synthetase-like amidotransferase/phosphosugar isomerase protein
MVLLEKLKPTEYRGLGITVVRGAAVEVVVAVGLIRKVLDVVHVLDENPKACSSSRFAGHGVGSL